ncbi:3-dehydroquinate dehydratase, type II [Bacillus cereus ATCC 10876]|nr:3-dehydroquinate dehydratase, type II [Bacillus cereus ATCC 10876]
MLYIGHKIGDYLLQTDYQAVNKKDNWIALISHCFIYTLAVSIMAYVFVGFFNWTAIFILFISHIIIDRKIFLNWWAKNIKRIRDTEEPAVQPGLIELDQAFHYIILFIISFL